MFVLVHRSSSSNLGVFVCGLCLVILSLDHTLEAKPAKVVNPTHGSGWIGSGPFYRHTFEPSGNPTHGSGWIGSSPFYRHLEPSGNPTHGSGWIGSGPFYRHTLIRLVIPPTAVGGLVQIPSTDIP